MLCEYYGIRIGFLNSFAEILPEFMIIFRGVAQIGGNVKTPAVGIIRRADPLLCYTQYVIMKGLGAFVIKLGQCIMSPPPVIGTVVGPAVFIVE